MDAGLEPPVLFGIASIVGFTVVGALCGVDHATPFIERVVSYLPLKEFKIDHKMQFYVAA